MLKTILLLFLEILPLFVFFIVGQYLPFLQAVGSYIGTTVVTIGVIWHLQKRVSFLALIFGGVIIISGTLSIWFSNPDILLISDTLYYLGAALVVGILAVVKINVMQKLFDHTFAITDTGWRILNQRWMIALALAGIGNELVRQFGSTDNWLWFQLARTIILVLFATYQFTLSKRYRRPGATAWGIRVQ